ncbi:MAG TPA: hypothetical protein VGS06_35185 [Streptosporangiaceae bacterium]|nr:hypothetical protein [Streptosporangiaceae bacterium]
MERMTWRVRRTRMMEQRPLRGRAGPGILAILGAGLLFAAVSGCGSVVASDSASAPAAAATAAPQVGCASVNQATAVAIRHMRHFMVPVDTKPQASTVHRQAAQVRALFGQMCAAVTHPAPNRLMHCPIDIGTEYLGTFYDGSRALATFAYYASGCERVSLSAAGKTLSTMVYGPAAAAAPHLATDLDAIVGAPKPGMMQPPAQVNPGGPNKPA